MILELQHWLLQQWDDFQFHLPRPDEISVIQRSSTWRNEQGKTVHLLFRRRDRQPFAVAKFTQNETYRESIVREFEQLRWMRQHASVDFNRTLPRPLWLGEIGGRTVYLESACPGQSLAWILSSRPLWFRRKVRQTFDLVVTWLQTFYRELPRHPVTLTPQEWQHLLIEPLIRFGQQFELSTTEARLLQRLEQKIIALGDQTMPLVPSHGDFGGGAILIQNRQIAVIDWEFFRPQHLPLFDLFKLLIHPGVAARPSPHWGLLDQFRALLELPWYAELARRLVLNLCAELKLMPELVGILFPIFLINLIQEHDRGRRESDPPDAGWRGLFTYYADNWAQHQFEKVPWLSLEGAGNRW